MANMSNLKNRMKDKSCYATAIKPYDDLASEQLQLFWVNIYVCTGELGII